MLNVYYCQAEGENEKQNQTSNVSLSDNICSCWSKGWFCIWTILVCSILLYNVGIGNMWVRRRVEIMSVTSTGYPHSDWQLPLTLENAVSAHMGWAFCPRHIWTQHFHHELCYHVTMWQLTWYNVNTCCINLVVEKSSPLLPRKIHSFLSCVLQCFGKDVWFSYSEMKRKHLKSDHSVKFPNPTSSPSHTYLPHESLFQDLWNNKCICTTQKTTVI